MNNDPRVINVLLKIKLRKLIRILQENTDNIFCDKHNKDEKDNIYNAIKELRGIVKSI